MLIVSSPCRTAKIQLKVILKGSFVFFIWSVHTGFLIKKVCGYKDNLCDLLVDSSFCKQDTLAKRLAKKEDSTKEHCQAYGISKCRKIMIGCTLNLKPYFESALNSEWKSSFAKLSRIVYSPNNETTIFFKYINFLKHFDNICTNIRNSDQKI